MIVVTDSIERIKPLLQQLPQQRQQQIIASWSQQASDEVGVNSRQAHTWLLPLKEAQFKDQSKPDNQLQAKVPYWITGKHDSIAIRVIAHPLIVQLCEQMVSSTNPYGLIVSTSCNPSGETPAKSFEQAYAYFGQDIAYLQGETLGYVLPSQISDALSGQVIR